jgi:membrane-associated protease RseP (regulator of RpoE activity)
LRKELLAPLAVLALGLAAAGGFFAASAALSEGGGHKAGGSRVVVQEREENDQAAPPGVLRRAYAGVVLAEEPNGEGVRITQVIAGSPAEDAGLETGDVITAVDGRSVRSVNAVQTALGDKSPGDEVTFTVRRDNREEDIDVSLGEQAGVFQMPSEVAPGQMMRPYLGVDLADITPELRRNLNLAQDRGVVILEVDSDGPAYPAGLRRGDVILQIGAQWVETAQEATAAILDHAPGDEVSLLIRRNAQELSVTARLASRPGTRSSVATPAGQQPSQEWLRSLLSDLGLDPNLNLTNLQDLFGRFARADAVLLDQGGQPVELHVAAGTLASVSGTEVRLAPNGGGAELRYSVTEKTRVVRGLVEGEIGDLRPGDRALVLTRGASDEALLILSPSFALEGGLSAVPVPGVPQLILPFGGLY